MSKARSRRAVAIKNVKIPKYRHDKLQNYKTQINKIKNVAKYKWNKTYMLQDWIAFMSQPY